MVDDVILGSQQSVVESHGEAAEQEGPKQPLPRRYGEVVGHFLHAHHPGGYERPYNRILDMLLHVDFEVGHLVLHLLEIYAIEILVILELLQNVFLFLQVLHLPFDFLISRINFEIFFGQKSGVVDGYGLVAVVGWFWGGFLGRNVFPRHVQEVLYFGALLPHPELIISILAFPINIALLSQSLSIPIKVDSIRADNNDSVAKGLL